MEKLRVKTVNIGQRIILMGCVVHIIGEHTIGPIFIDEHYDGQQSIMLECR